MKRIHCLGVMVVDALSGPLPAYPLPRKRVQVVTEKLVFQPGGGAVNTASALARMGLPAAIFSRVGDDPNGAFLRQELTRLGVDIRGVRVAAGDTTPFTYVGIHPDGERTFIHTPGANLGFAPADLDRQRLMDTDLLIYQDLWVLPGLDGQPGAELLAEARRRGVVTLLDECWGLGPRREVLEAMLPHCDYVLPSVDDLQVIYPDLGPEAIGHHLRACGAGTVVLKMGRQGCLVVTADTALRIPALDVPVVDATGAGDCFDAGFLAGLAHGEDVSTAARLGTACAAFCLSAVGGSAGVPSYAEVRRRALDVTG